jgi:hypothetical protein
MPRETILCDDTPLHIGWQRDASTVQLGVGVAPLQHGVGNECNTVLRQLYGSESSRERIGRTVAATIMGRSISDPGEAAELGGKVLDAIENEGDVPTYYFESLWTGSAGRGSINTLIQVLRRARDAAFGADA